MVLPPALLSALLPRFERPAFVGLAAVMVVCGTLEGQQPSFGPLTYEEGSPLQRLAYTPAIEGADVVGRGVWGIDVHNGFSNIFEQDSTATHVLFLDMERLTTALTLRWGATERLETGARLALETTGGGALDDFIVGWHDRLGFGNANRDRFPADEYRQVLTDGNGSVYLDKPAQTFSIRDVRAFAKWRAWRSLDGRSVVSLRTVLRIPSAGPRQGNDGADGAAMALWRAGMGPWYMHGVVGLALTHRSPEMEPVLRPHTTFVAVAVERSLGRRLAALAQIQIQSAALRSFDHRELDRAPTNLLLGLAGRVGDAWTWDASFQEDIPADTPAVDFTVTLRVGRRW
ncbi:MAG: DUF3187 family protein [Gemmatimonadota bacterium]|nr:DUF3187 family protein [Gemmatimonadota bacterium]